MSVDMSKENKLSGVPTYAPSWFDKFATWVNRLPGSSWLAYLTLVSLLAGVGILIQWFEEPSQPVSIPSVAILGYFQIVYVLSLMDYLDKRAKRALETFRPILKGDETLYLTLKNKLTVLPSRPTIILTVFIFVLFTILGVKIFTTSEPIQALASPSGEIFTHSPIGYYSFAVFSLIWLVNSLFIYHTFRQLKVIDYIYTQCSEINLFRQNELYAFSNLSAGTAIGFVLSSPAWLIIDPGIVTLIINIVLGLMAIIIFVAPLLGAHNLLRNQKDVLIKNSLQKKEGLILELFSRIEDHDLTDIENYERALSSLEKAHNEIESISTWPWKTETIQQMIGALLLPISIWMIQFYLNQLLTN